jgi:hypothetical protein
MHIALVMLVILVVLVLAVVVVTGVMEFMAEDRLDSLRRDDHFQIRKLPITDSRGRKIHTIKTNRPTQEDKVKMLNNAFRN